MKCVDDPLERISSYQIIAVSVVWNPCSFHVKSYIDQYALIKKVLTLKHFNFSLKQVFITLLY